MQRVKQIMHPQQSTSADLETGLYDRSTIVSRIPHPIYAHSIAWLSEFISTTFFLFLALSGEQAAFSVAGSSTSTLLYASLSHGFAFAVSSWIFFRVTSGLFNPVITLGMCFVDSITWVRAIVVIIAQFLGAMSAAGLVDAIFPGPLVPTMALGVGTSTARGFFIELFLTMCFVLMVFVIASDRHKAAQYVAPVGLGLALFTVDLSSILYTGGSLNPARAFAVALVSHRWPSYHWIYWLAPIIGCIVASVMFRLVKALEHEISAAQRRAVQDVKPSHKQETVSEEARPGNRLSVVPEDDVEKGEV